MFQLLIYLLLLPVIALATDGTVRDVLLYIHAFGLACFILLDTSETGSGSSMYNLRHVLFNLDIPPKTLWFNMGFWDSTTRTYSEACTQLVQKVTTSMGLRKNTRILDVGYGCGDSCFWLADQYNCQVVGVTNEMEQWRISCTRLGTQYAQLEDRIQLIQGSATDIDHLLKDQPLFDHIISIDSAYHYSTRWDFLQAALSRLVPGGTVGLYDLTASQTTEHSGILKYICQRMLELPGENMVTADEYKDRLVAMGYTDVHVEVLDRDQVFGGLSRFIDQQYKQSAAWDVLPPFGKRVFMRGSVWLFGLLSRKDWLQPVIVRGKKAQ